MLRRLSIPVLIAAAALIAAAPAMAETKTETFRFPVAVKGYQVKQEMTFGVQHPQVDGHITGMSVNVVDADGTAVPISRLMLHHIVFATVRAPNPICPSLRGFRANQKRPGLASPIYGAGEERNVLALPPAYGLPTRSADSWLMTWMLMNHR